MEGHFPFPLIDSKPHLVVLHFSSYSIALGNTTLFFWRMYCILRIADENSQGRDADVTASFLAAPHCLLNVDKLLLLHQTGSVNHCEKIWLRKILPSMMNTKLSQQRFLRCLENGLIKRTARRNLYEFIYYVGFPLLWLMVYPV